MVSAMTLKTLYISFCEQVLVFFYNVVQEEQSFMDATGFIANP